MSEGLLWLGFYQRYPDPNPSPENPNDPSPTWRQTGICFWDEALDYVATRLSAIKAKYGPDAIQTTGSSRGTGNETNYVMQKFARAVIGTNNVDCCARV